MPKKQNTLRVTLNELQSKQMIDLIKYEMGLIAAEYEDKQYYTYLTKVLQRYQGIHGDTDFPIKNGSNRVLLLLTMMVDIVSHRAARQTDGANPMFLLESEENISASELNDRQNYLDFKCRGLAKLPDLHQIWYKYALLQRAAVVKTLHSEETEYFKEEITYIKDNIKDYENKYLAELLNPKSKETEEHKKIEAGETVVKAVDNEMSMYYGPKSSRVELNRFLARLSIKDFNKQRVHGEEMQLTWADIKERYDNRFYDSDAVLTLMEKYPKDYSSRTYRVGEFIVRIALPEELDPNQDMPAKPGKLRKYVVTYEMENDLILRSIHYPFKHNQSMYTAYSAFPNDQTWWAEGLFDRLEDTCSAADAFLNSMINQYTLAHQPIIACSDPRFDGGRVTLDNMSVLKFQPNTLFSQIKYEQPSQDALANLNFIVHFGELVTGVIASLASGAETPGDSNAPAVKTAMKMQAGNMRMQDLITNLQIADTVIAEQIDSLCHQYRKQDNVKEENYFKDNEKQTLSYETLGKRVRYVCHGSRISFDKFTDQKMVVEATMYIAKFFPSTLNDVDAAYTLLSAYVNSSEGSVEKNRDVILSPLKKIVDAKAEIKKLMETIKTQQNGVPTPEQKAMLDKIGMSLGAAAGGGQPGQPSAPPGQTPQPPMPNAGGPQ